MIIFNRLISNLVHFFPKALIYQFAKRYVAGTEKNTALDIIKSLNDDGYLVTLDILGEHTKEHQNANHITDQ